jgi:sortase (surface protein transpeptidase)
MTDATADLSDDIPADVPVVPGAPVGIGRRRFLVGLGAAAGAGALAGLAPAAPAAAAVPAGASRFVALGRAVRVVDTRPEFAAEHSFHRVSDRRIRVRLGGRFGIPDTATAVVLTLAGVNRSEPNWVVAFPSGTTTPIAANLNLRDPGEINANLVTVKLSDTGRLDVRSRVPCDVILDAVGYYEPVTGPVRAGRFVGLPTARRALDTRPNQVADGSFTMVDVTDLGVPADASSVVINLTATETTRSGWFAAVPMGLRTKPTTSSLNVQGTGSTRGASVIVPLTNVGGRLRFKVYALHAAKLVVDVVGFMTGPASRRSGNGLFVPVVPRRLLDTREPGQIGRLWPGWVVVAPVNGAAKDAAAVVCNVTGVDSRGPGHFRVSPARRAIPETASVNWSRAGAYVPNHVITRISTAGLQIYSSHGAHAVVDLFGYYTGSPAAANRPPHENPPPPPAVPAWTLRLPRIGVTSMVLQGDAAAVTDAGYSWHWTGTGFLGEAGAHVVSFAHRTSAGGPYRNLHVLEPGDEFTVTTGDRREYTYRMVRRDLTDSNVHNILAATRSHPGSTFSLVACTVGYDSSKSAYPNIWAPTSTKFRIVVTAELVGWREL